MRQCEFYRGMKCGVEWVEEYKKKFVFHLFSNFINLQFDSCLFQESIAKSIALLIAEQGEINVPLFCFYRCY